VDGETNLIRTPLTAIRIPVVQPGHRGKTTPAARGENPGIQVAILTREVQGLIAAGAALAVLLLAAVKVAEDHPAVPDLQGAVIN